MAPRYQKINNRNVRNYTLAEVVEKYRAAVNDNLRREDGKPLSPSLRDWQGRWRRGDEDFLGGDAEDVLRHLDHGYDFPPVAFAPDFSDVTFESEGSRWRWNDEDGDYEHVEWLAGEDNYYLDRRIEPGKPGIYLNASLDFMGSVKPDVIAQYGAWVGSAVEAVQGAGYDVSLRIVARGREHVEGEKGTHEFVIEVKRFGDELLPRDYGVLFSPVGYRHLIFLTYFLPEVYEGKRIPYGLGRAVEQSWNVEYDEDTRTLNFGCDGHAKDFPADDMTQALIETRERF